MPKQDKPRVRIIEVRRSEPDARMLAMVLIALVLREHAADEAAGNEDASSS